MINFAEYTCGNPECGKKFKGELKVYQRHYARGYNVYCSEICSVVGRKIAKRISSRRASKIYDEKRPPRKRKERLEKIKNDPVLYQKYKEWQREWYSKKRYGPFYEVHRTLLNLTKPMWRNK